MEQKRIRQGVPVRQVQEKKLEDMRLLHAVSWGFLTLVLAAFLSMGHGDGAAFAILTLFAWLAYTPWAAYELLHYTFAAEDGIYIVRCTFAVHIPWEKIESAEVIPGYKSSSIRLRFAPEILDEVTGTPIVIKAGRDDVLHYSQTVLNCLKRHVPVTASAE